MAASINASTTAGVVTTADTSGVLNIQTANTTAISISASQVVSYTNNPTYSGGTANGVLYLNGSKVATSGSALTFNGSQLDVTGSIRAINSSTASIAFNDGTTQSTIGFNGAGSFTATTAYPFVIGTTANQPVYFNINSTEGMRLTSTGLGIGTSSPTNALTVGTTSAGKNIAIYSSSNGNNGLLRMFDLGGTERLQLSANSTGEAVYYAPTGSVHAWYVNTERMRLDSSGNLGLGVTPSAWRSTYKALQTNGGSFYGFTSNDRVGMSQNAYVDATSFQWTYTTTAAATNYLQISGEHQWYRAASGTAGTAITFTQAMTLDASGNLLVGTTSQVGSGLICAVADAGVKNPITVKNTGSPAASGIYFEYFLNSSNAAAGGIAHTASTTTAYVTSSDYRLKENVQPMLGALDKISALKPVTYTWKDDGSDGEGFIAHELQEVCPQAVVGAKDAVDADGNPVYQGIDTSFLVATLTAAIKELKAEFDAYKATHP